MRIELAVAALLLHSVTAAANPDATAPTFRDGGVDGVTITLIDHTQSPPRSVTIFRMRSGGCMRGPLSIYDGDGTERLRLEPGVEYPTGCGLKGGNQ